ncbi:MAG TPA: DUF3341 domain-containing protein [Candidatus Limnocylindria bacterium]|nr:DUF3341 domain-containing protein [Candidatus Limnocylindria bacterium]
MSNKSVLCIAESRSQAEKIVNGLKHSGFANNDISALFPDQGGTRDFAHAKGTKAPEGAVAGVSGGALLGGALGWLAGVGALILPGIGPFVAAGPILAALSGVAVGGAVGGITGAVVGMGFPEYEAKRYEGKVLDGNILISVHTDNANDIRRAKHIFEQELAQDIAVAGESEVINQTLEHNPDDIFHTIR